MLMSSHFRWLIWIVLVTGFSVWVALPDTKLTNMPDSCYESEFKIPKQGIHIDTDGDCVEDITINVQQSLGLDLVGGLRVLLEAELPPGSFSLEDMREAANNVNRRVNQLGLSEATVQVQGSNRILVELPGVRDRQQAIDTIQQTALLEFVDFAGLNNAQVARLEGQKILTSEQVLIESQRRLLNTPEVMPEATAEATEATQSEREEDVPPVVEIPRLTNPVTGEPFQTVMTGAMLQAASAQLGPQGQWYIEFEVKPEAVNIFSAFTASRVGQPMAIVLDGEVLSAPTIQDALTTGGVIRGSFTEEEAKTLALQLRSGSLPIPFRVETAEEVGATLGQESVRLSVRAGIIGVLVVLSFMLIYYRVPGVSADLALLVFVALNIAVFKLLPVTLTLPAITGFLISIGTAVDGNILIFERIKEELRAGKDLDLALQSGFDRAWNSIRDSNLSTIIICGILFLFGQTPGASIVSGFAVTLAIGLVLNLFTAVIVTRTFLHLFVAALRPTLQARKWLLGV